MNINQQHLSEIKKAIIRNEKPYEFFYYGILLNLYKNIDKYLEQLSNIYDKIHLAQWAYNKDKIKELETQIELTGYERKKYESLKKNNEMLDMTLDFRLLSPKYEFINDMLDILSCNVDIQEQLTSLSDNRLKLFKILYSKLKTISNYNVTYVSKILLRLGYVSPQTNNNNNFHQYENLTTEIENELEKNKQLTEKDIQSLLYLYTSDMTWDIQSLKDLKDFQNNKSKDFKEFERIIANQTSKNKEEKNLSAIKKILLLKAFGIHLIAAKKLLEKYDISNLKVSYRNKYIVDMYNAIKLIVDEKDAEKLISIYNDFSKTHSPSFNLLRITTFENDLRKEFAKCLNASTFKTVNHPYKVVDGVKVIDAGTNFYIILTVIGAFKRGFKEQENYMEYWNAPKIKSHGNCCSLISNNNLSMIYPKNIILGFSRMDEDMLMLCNVHDINSTPNSINFDLTINHHKQKFTTPEKLMGCTRSNFNELVFERRDLSENKTSHKKNPDYIVFVEEYENIDSYINHMGINTTRKTYLLTQKLEQEKQWNESLKAAKDFGIPIVKINRETCAKNSINKINKLLKKFEEEKDPQLIDLIINEFESNRIGNGFKHELIREMYFSKSAMKQILQKIEKTILCEKNKFLKNALINAYEEAIKTEKEKFKDCDFFRSEDISSGFNFEKKLDVIKQLKNNTYVIKQIKIGGR